MLKCYVFFYACSVAVTTYMAFLEMPVEEKDGSENGWTGAEAKHGQRKMAKRSLLQEFAQDDDLLSKKFMELYRAMETVKLQKLQSAVISEPDNKGLATKGRKERMERFASLILNGNQRGDKMTEIGTVGSLKTDRDVFRQSRLNQTEVRPWRKSSGKRIKRQEPDDYSDEANPFPDDDYEVPEGIFKYLFVDHLLRTLVFFCLLQVLLFVCIWFICWCRGYMAFTAWSLKRVELFTIIKELLLAWRHGSRRRTDGNGDEAGRERPPETEEEDDSETDDATRMQGEDFETHHKKKYRKLKNEEDTLSDEH